VFLSREEQLGLFAKHMDLARHWARRYRRRKLDRRHFDIADLEQAAYFGLWTAALKFDPDRLSVEHFRIYAARWIKNSLREETRYRYAVAMSVREMRAGRPWPKPVDMPELCRTDDDATPDDADEEVIDVLASLPPKEWRVMSLYYGFGADGPIPTDEIAMRMGTSPAMVNRHHRQARARLVGVLSRSRAG
jgi:RNA polymerase sigma factor (sigma-70 family)